MTENDQNAIGRVLVISMYTEAIACYAHAVKAVQQRYCKLHGFDYRCYDKIHPECTGRHVTWNKFYYLRDILANESYDKVVWMDMDLIPVNLHHNLFEFIRSDVDLVIESDLAPSEAAQYDCRVNTGLMVFKNTEWSRETIADVIERPQSRAFYACRFHEQTALGIYLGESLERRKRFHKLQFGILTKQCGIGIIFAHPFGPAKHLLFTYLNKVNYYGEAYNRTDLVDLKTLTEYKMYF